MKKIAIITTHHEPNYGNKLQNYALQTVIHRMGYRVETINDARSYIDLISWKAQKENIYRFIIKRHFTWSQVKHAKFFFWSKRYIKYSSTNIHSDADIIGLADKYDVFVVGSDQIWNPEWKIFSNDFGFAKFARKEQKVAYAPSLGVTEMIPERVEEYKNYLKDWKALSCREQSGADIIESLIGKRVPVVLDPTLLLNADDWNKLASKRLVKEPYLLLYTLRPISEDIKKEIENLQNKYSLRLVSLNEGKFSGSGPSEFLSLIKYSDVVVTDSFHGSVFALQFHRNLVVCDLTQKNEKSKLSRLTNLFSTLELRSAILSEKCNKFFNVDWTLVNGKLKIARMNSLRYLKYSL